MSLYKDALPSGIESRHIDNGNGIEMHVLEAGEGKDVALLLHGFPEIAYSWRKVIPALAESGYRVIAPDLRGYGLTSGWDADYDCDLSLFRPINMVRDVLGLLAALYIDHTALIAGHDYGANVAANCALIRPDVFRAVSLMSAPYVGPPSLKPGPTVDIVADLAALERPRKHYHRYYAMREANEDMTNCPQGVHDFMRGYYHFKSADWTDNKPYRLQSWSAPELAKMPTYYIMDLEQNMAETAASEMPSAKEISECTWLFDDDLTVYSECYAQTTFQGGLNGYRCRFVDAFTREAEVFAGRTIEVPTCFISGASDWGVYQVPGALDNMQKTVCTDFRACHLIDGAGHWVQQEQADEVTRLLLAFLAEV